MVDNLAKAFEKATERYLDQISSSDDEIAVEYPESESDSKSVIKKKKVEGSSKRKPTLVAHTDKKRDRSISEDSVEKISDPLEKIEKKSSVKVAKKGAKDGKKGASKRKKTQESKKSKKQVSPVISRSPSVDKWSSSPPPSWPPSSPEMPKKASNHSVYSTDDDTKRKIKGIESILRNLTVSERIFFYKKK